MTEENRAFDQGTGSILANLYEELHLADHIYGLALQMKQELEGVAGGSEPDSDTASRLVRMEHEAGRALRRAVETEARLMAALNGEPAQTQAGPETAAPADSAAGAPADTPPEPAE